MEQIVVDKYWGRVVDTMNEALLIISREGVILSVNRSFEEMTGYAAAEAVGKRCTLLECSACELYINGNSSGWCKLFDPKFDSVRRCRCEIVKKDGSTLPALKNASVLYDDDGNQLGAVETLTDISEIDRLDRKVELLTQQLDETDGYCGLIGLSNVMQRVYGIIEKAALSDAPVIIFGESGTGKELVANSIHYNSQRAKNPCIKVNCAALPVNLIESELFGHEKGAFTGAIKQKIGKFELAHIECFSHLSAATQRAQNRYVAAGRLFLGKICRGKSKRHPKVLHAGHRHDDGIPLAGKCERARKLYRARRAVM